MAKQKNYDHPSYTSRDRNNDRRVILIIIGFLFFSPTSVVVFQTFVCETFEDGTEALVADSSIMCYTSAHIFYIVYACIMVLIYPIGTCTVHSNCFILRLISILGIPLYYFFHLYRRRNLIDPILPQQDGGAERNETGIQQEKIALRKRFDRIKNLRFLYGSYLPRHMYFEIVDCLRRLLLTALPILFLRSTILQIVIVLLISLAFNAVYMELKPYVSDSDNKVSNLCQWVITLTLIGSLCIRVDMAGEVGFGPEVVVHLF